jgi:hypothetical protein
MRGLIPFTDELLQLGAQVILRGKIDDAQPLALPDTEPLFDLIHPRTMQPGEMHHKARMIGEPSGGFLPVLHGARHSTVPRGLDMQRRMQ